MKTKTININEELWSRMQECMARTKIFNASEFIRLSLEAAVDRIERRYGIVVEGKPQDEAPELPGLVPTPPNGNHG